MFQIAPGPQRDRALAALDRAALTGVLLSPVLLLHAHGFAEVAIGIVCAAFLVRSALESDWAWASTPWMRAAWAWSLWVIVCSLPVPALHLGEGGIRSLVQAAAFVRFPVFIAAIAFWVLRAPDRRRWMYWLIAASTAYIAVHTVFQFVFGVNLYGEASGPAGELTGPFGKPRAGPPLARILLPAIVPVAAAWLTQSGARPVAKALLTLIGGVALVVIVGQRMPLLLTCLGLAVVGALLPRLRWSVAAAGVAVVLLLAVSPVVAPKAHHRLVEQFSSQMSHFSSSHYGKLYARALEIGIRNPIDGLGAEGFRTGCPDPQYFRPSFDGADATGGGREICWNHPHNYYFEALVLGGVPGLILFSVMALAFLGALGKGLWRDPDPLRVALFAAAFLHFWPIASSTGFTAMPVAGWSFLLLGWGLAEARWPKAAGAPI